jgi:hypothetical protein
MSPRGCQDHRAVGGMHEFRIEGTPRSAMTFYVCGLCGNTQERGRGAFHGMPQPEPNYATTTDHVRRIIREEIRSALGESSSHE